MNGFLLDTNTISEATRLRPSPRVLEWIDNVDEETVYLSVLTLGELRNGIARLAHGRIRSRLESWLDIEIPDRFAGRILPVDAAIADRWGQLSATAAQHGRPIPAVDGLLAATALLHNLAVVSRNASDFSGTGVAIVDPWRE